VTSEPSKESVAVPLGYPTSTFYLDDSGVLAGGSRILVVGGIKVRRHGELLRAVRHIRDQTGFRREFKFEGINKGSAAAYYAMIDALEKSDAHIVAIVGRAHDAKSERPAWLHYATLTAQLVCGSLNRRELASLLMDEISTPTDVAFEDVVRGMVNKRLDNTSVISAACLTSHSSDGLQIADLVASAIAFDRRRIAGESGKANSIKGRIVQRLKDAFGGVDLLDRREGRVNIHSHDRARQGPKPLKLVHGRQRAS
jgi:hypothetical protein